MRRLTRFIQSLPGGGSRRSPESSESETTKPSLAQTDGFQSPGAQTGIVAIRAGAEPASAGANPSVSHGARLRLPPSLVLPALLPPLLLVWGLQATRVSARHEMVLRELHGRLQGFGPVGRELQISGEREERLKGRIEAIRKLGGNRLQMVDRLESIRLGTSRVPGLWLTRLSLDPSGLVIGGRSLKAAGLETLLQHLQEPLRPYSLEINRSFRNQESGAWEFELRGHSPDSRQRGTTH